MRHEFGARHEVEKIVLFVCLELLLPITLADDNAFGNFALVTQEDQVSWIALGVAKRGLLRANDEIARLFELYRKEERRRNIDALYLPALRVRAAALDVIRPKDLARLIRLPVEEIVVMLADKSLRNVDWITVSLWNVIDNLQRGGSRRADGPVERILKHEGRRLSALGVTVVAN